jgi:ferredoxin
MLRKIITIDEEKCTGCGQCIPDCPEGALQLLDGKARLISDLFCDGLGACIGTCPEGAITVTEREAGAYDEQVVMGNIALQGESVITAHLEHLADHGERDLYHQAVTYLKEHNIPIPVHPSGESSPKTQIMHNSSKTCPGAAAQMIPQVNRNLDQDQSIRTESQLRQWPVQLKLLNPANPYFDHADLLISADCVPFAYPDFHRDLLRNKIVIIFCPKLDADIEEYISKLTTILKTHQINSITTVHMEVPCCSGISNIVSQALKRSEKEIRVEDVIITLQGKIA